MWVTTTDLPTAASHPFYTRLNQLLHQHGFDDFAEAQCALFYAETIGRPSLPPAIAAVTIQGADAGDTRTLPDTLG